jgi:hypothetical protein
MPNILYPPSRPQSVGEILDSAFRIFGATVVKSLPVAALGLIAGQLPNIYYVTAGGGVRAMVAAAYKPLWIELYILGYVIAVILWSVILLRQHAIATGDSAAAHSAFARTVRRAPAVVAVWTLVVLAVAACFVPAMAFRSPTRYLAGVLLLIPAGYVGVQLSCAWASLLVTGRGAVASLTHSWRLTSGSFWRLSVIYTVGVVLLFVLNMLSGLIAAAIALPFAHGDVAVIYAVATVVTLIVGAIGTPFYTALALAVLGDLSVRKEGTDLAQRISAPAAQ